MGREASKKLRPKIPDWALWAGLPQPEVNEDFAQYVTRLGLDPKGYLDGLTENTFPIANRRLATDLMRKFPEKYEAYVQARRRGI